MPAVVIHSQDVDRVIGATVRALLRAAQVQTDDLADHLGVSRSALYQKLSGNTSFRASEVATVAEFLDVEVADLYDGLGGRISDPKSRTKRRRASSPRQQPAG